MERKSNFRSENPDFPNEALKRPFPHFSEQTHHLEAWDFECDTYIGCPQTFLFNIYLFNYKELPKKLPPHIRTTSDILSPRTFYP